MRALLLILVGLLMAAMTGCRPEYEAPTPYDFSNKPGSGRFSPAIRGTMDGVYSVAGGNEQFGNQVAVRWSYVHDGPDTVHTLTILTGINQSRIFQRRN